MITDSERVMLERWARRAKSAQVLTMRAKVSAQCGLSPKSCQIGRSSDFDSPV
ncbi:hypothetical protein ACRYCC_10240 [Actinomadura scrupuli]|uniref:hypothetical protein n=1 Tax=Actinomadura scrupuli TaxID=559629 RepID=UPI003D95E943